MRTTAVLGLVALATWACRPSTEGPASGSPAASQGHSSWVQEGCGMGRTALTSEPGPRALPGIAWTNPVAQEVLSEPVFGIAGGKPAVLMGSGQDLVAFDLDSGRTLWSYATASPITAAPAVIGPHAWVLALDGIAFQLSTADGKLVKEHEQDFTLEASPLLAGKLLVFEETSQSGQVDESRLHAIDPATGAEAWHQDYAKGAGRAPSSDGQRVFVSVYDGVRAFDLASGTPAWSAIRPPMVRAYAPIVVGTTVLAVHGSYGPGEVTAYDASSGAVRWNVKLPSRLAGLPAATETELLVPTGDRKVQRVTIADGAVAGTLDPGGPVDARPAISPQAVFVATGQTVVAFDRTTMEEAWRLELESLEVSRGGIAHLVVMGHRLIVVRLDGHVHALEAPAGA